jgi:PKD repeat protein
LLEKEDKPEWFWRKNMLSFAGRSAAIISVVVTLGLILGTAVASDPLQPVASFTYNPCVMCAAPGNVVFFNANYSTTPTGKIFSYTWNFGDGTPLLIINSSSTTHMYGGQPAKWQVTLTVQDSNHQTDTVSQLVIFHVAPRFTSHPASPEAGQTVSFNASSTIIYSQFTQPQNFLWSFGDGTNATGTFVEHVYHTPGVYRATLSVVTTVGNATISKTLIVRQDPPVGGGGGGRAIPE